MSDVEDWGDLTWRPDHTAETTYSYKKQSGGREVLGELWMRVAPNDDDRVELTITTAVARAEVVVEPELDLVAHDDGLEERVRAALQPLFERGTAQSPPVVGAAFEVRIQLLDTVPDELLVTIVTDLYRHLIRTHDSAS